ncbi:MAG: hypothetical protein DA328_05495 [Nitrososphaeraceae archaeon]|nr:hypothetical protein [Nitrososphaeraceae archaeon]
MKKKSNMPGSARAGLVLLVLGAIIVSTGTFTEREVLSIYGFIMAIMGFSLYMITSIYIKKRR